MIYMEDSKEITPQVPNLSEVPKMDLKSRLESHLEVLYNEGIATFKRTVETSEIKDNIPKVDFIPFNDWYQGLSEELFKTGDIKDTTRLNKIIQFGNFGVTQPTGGFVLRNFLSPEFIKEQYVSALRKSEPVLMVISEPFINPEFFSEFNNVGITYKIIPVSKKGTKPCGLLYNKEFDEKYLIYPHSLTNTIKDTSVFKLMNKKSVIPGVSSGGMGYFGWSSKTESKPASKPANSTVVNSKANQDLARARSYQEGLLKPIIIVNFHGDSKGKLEEFNNFIDVMKDPVNDVHFILGDSNITLSKTSKTTEQVLKDKGLEHIAYSTQIVEKTREICDILKNNQLDKSDSSSEIDGMFAVDLKTMSDSIHRIGNVEKVSAFETPYSLETPILGDHSVVGLMGQMGQMGIKGLKNPFTLLSATGSSMDDPKKGVFGNKEQWNGVDMSKFHKEFGKPYTLAWIKTYNEWEKSFIPFVEEYGKADVLIEYKAKIDKMIQKEKKMNPDPKNTTGGSKRKAHNHISKRKAHKPGSKRLSKRKQVRSRRKRSRKVH